MPILQLISWAAVATILLLQHHYLPFLSLCAALSSSSYLRFILGHTLTFKRDISLVPFFSYHTPCSTTLSPRNTDSQNTRAPKSRSSISHSCTDSLDSGSSEHTPLYDFPSAIRYFVTGLWIRSQVTFLHQMTTPLTLISPSPANISSSTKPILTNMLVVLTDYLLRKHLSHCRKQ